jgi:hypothetical protein
MANITFFPATATYGVGHVGTFGMQGINLYRRYIDVLDTTTWGVTATTWASANTVQLVQVPIGAYIIAGGLEIVRAETVTTTATLSWGTTAAATAWASAQASNATAGTMAAALLNTAGTSINVATATQLTITVNTAALTNCAFAVWVLMFQGGQKNELT